MTVFHLVRHGEHVLAGRVLAGRTPGVGLSERGRGEIAAVPLGQSDPGRAPGKHSTGQDVLAVPHQMKHRHRR